MSDLVGNPKDKFSLFVSDAGISVLQGAQDRSLDTKQRDAYKTVLTDSWTRQIMSLIDSTLWQANNCQHLPVNLAE